MMFAQGTRNASNNLEHCGDKVGAEAERLRKSLWKTAAGQAQSRQGILFAVLLCSDCGKEVGKLPIGGTE